jgi:hypothetical protein
LSDRSLLCPNNPWASPRVDLGDSGAVVAALINGEDYGPAKDGVLGAQWTTPRAFGKSTTAKEIPDLPKLRGKRDLTSNNLPRLLWLSNSKEPRTVTKFARTWFLLVCAGRSAACFFRRDATTPTGRGADRNIIEPERLHSSVCGGGPIASSTRRELRSQLGRRSRRTSLPVNVYTRAQSKTGLGQKRKSRPCGGVSALPPTADITLQQCDIRKVPNAEVLASLREQLVADVTRSRC